MVYFTFRFWQDVASDMPEVWRDKLFSRQKQKQKAGSCLQKMVSPIDFTIKNAQLNFWKEKTKSGYEISTKWQLKNSNNHLRAHMLLWNHWLKEKTW